MRFLADECCDAALVDVLRGVTDDDLLTRAVSERRILLTEDKDFGKLVYRLRRPAHGIVLLRFDVGDRALEVPRLRYLLEKEPERLPGAFAVLEVDKVRVRPLT